MSSAWLFFKCLVGSCSSFSKVENRGRKDIANLRGKEAVG